MEAAPSIQVMVVDSSPIVCAGVTALLGSADDIDVVATADSLKRARQRYAHLDVDVLVTGPAALGLTPGPTPGPGAVDKARWSERVPGARVVMLTDVVDERVAHAVSVQGIDACLHLTSVKAYELASAVRGVVRGRATFSSEFLPHLIGRARRERVPTRLTARENDILELLARGHTNDAIARALGLAAGTVRIYVSGILAKLGAPNRTAAAVQAIRERLVDPTLGHDGAG
jgi:DNA-binding NarL/FixJ family response regulator